MMFKNIFSFIAMALFLFALNVSQAEVKRGITDPLLGEYLIGTNGDFATLEDAIDTIDAYGIAAPVTLKIRVGYYQTHVTIGDFTRAGLATDVLTITSESPQSSPILQHDAQNEAENWLIKFDQASYVTINNLVLEATGTMDLNNIVVFENSNSNIEISNSEFNSYPVNDSTDTQQAYSINQTTASTMNQISILNNEFDTGNGGIRMRGAFNAPSNTLLINNNIFFQQNGLNNFYTIDVSFVNDLFMNSNTIYNTVRNSKAATLFYINSGEITGNDIAMLGGGPGNSALAIARTNEGINDLITIKNNFITSAKESIIVRSPQSNNIDILHNTLLIDRNEVFGVQSQALNVGSSGSNINILNNIMINTVSDDNAHIMVLEDSSLIAASDGNLFHGTSINQFEINAINYANLTDYQMASSLDDNSVFKAVDFVDKQYGDLHLSYAQFTDPDFLAAPVAVVLDIDGDERDALTPFIGADELFSDVIFADSFEAIIVN